jgi:hypothetical protein
MSILGPACDSSARAREGPNGYFIVVLLRDIFNFRKQISELCGFAALWIRLTFVHDFDYFKPDQRERDRVCCLVEQFVRNVRGVAIAQEIGAVTR